MLPFPCQSKVILAPFLSSPQWDAPVSLIQAEMLPNTAVGRGASGEGSTPQLRFIHGTPELLGTDSAPQGQHSSSVCTQRRGTGWSFGARGEWPEQGVRRGHGPTAAAGSLNPGAGFSAVSPQLQPSELTQCLFGERVECQDGTLMGALHPQR